MFNTKEELEALYEKWWEVKKAEMVGVFDEKMILALYTFGKLAHLQGMQDFAVIVKSRFEIPKKE